MENNLNEVSNQQSSTNPMQIPLPNSTAVLVLGILSIALCWCYGIIGITLGIIALVLANKAKKLYKENPDNYTLGSYKNMQAGYICAIIGLSLSGLYLLFIIIYFLIIGAALTTMFSSFPWDAVNY
ncbi:MAG: CCC motif membrane protein [Bacteroidales bacterium]|nr:CCC motif membrane protein [Bacteroidales bacterium]